jgi:hypothetical protein
MNLNVILDNTYMNSIESIIFQLTSGLVSETSIPNQYVLHPKIVNAIQKHNWLITTSNNMGWTHLIRIVTYSS